MKRQFYFATGKPRFFIVYVGGSGTGTGKFFFCKDVDLIEIFFVSVSKAHCKGLFERTFSVSTFVSLGNRL